MNRLPRCSALLIPWLIGALAASAAAQQPPRHAAEASDYRGTSTLAQVNRFLDQLADLPHAERLRREVLGTTNEGRQLPLVVVGEPCPPDDAAILASGKLRLCVNANIHAGEVEGKEAVQALLRELALGGHAELLEHAVLLFVPVYNADGNERISPGNRVSQNGPERGVGERPNAQGLDLNRDFIKAEAPETRAMLRLFRRLDPHLWMDLHTTNGSTHGYQLTYAPSLSTNAPPELDAFARRTLLPEVTRRLAERDGIPTFHYGNFGGEDPRRWDTYDHRPRFGTNYYALRGRLGILSEAYSYLNFESRIRATRAFTLEVLRACVRHADELQAMTAPVRDAGAAPSWTFGVDSSLVAGELGPILVGSIDSLALEGLGTRRRRLPGAEPVEHLIRVAFESARRLPAPRAWALAAPSDALLELLGLHGIEYTRLASTRPANVRAFRVDELRRMRRPFQGHHEVRLQGEWIAGPAELPAGTLWVPAGQRLGRVAAQLLEPESEDSFTTWNGFDAELSEGAAHPVWRVE